VYVTIIASGKGGTFFETQCIYYVHCITLWYLLTCIIVI